MSTARVLVCSLALVTSFAAHAGIWGERGYPRQIIVRGSLAYAADGRGVAVYDVADPAHMRAIDIESRDAETVDIAEMGERELVTATSIGVERFTIDDDGTLRFTGWLPAPSASLVTGSSTWGAAASGREVRLFEATPEGLRSIAMKTMTGDVIALAAVDEYLYVSVDRRGTYVFRASSMQEIAVIAQTANDFELAGKLLWGTAPAGGVFALNVNDPRDPRRLSISEVETKFDDIAVLGTRVYALTTSGEVQIFNAASASSPQRIATMNEGADAIAVTTSRLITSRIGAPLRVFDAAGVFNGELTDLAGPVSGIWTDGSLAYVVDPPYLRVLDVSKTNAPQELRSILVPDIQDRIRVKNGIAVLYGKTLVNIIDVSDPLHPRHVGTWNTDGLPPSNAAIANGTIVEANNHSGLHIVDYSNPAAAAQIGGRIWHYLDMAAADDVIYALQDGYFIVLEIVDGRIVVEHGVETVPTSTDLIEIAPPNATQPEFVLTRGAESVRVYDVRADRFAPVFLGEIALASDGVVATGSGVAYVDVNGTLHTIDLALAESATDTGLPVTSAMQVSVAGTKVAVADRYRVRVYGPDTASPIPPVTPTRRRAVRK